MRFPLYLLIACYGVFVLPGCTAREQLVEKVFVVNIRPGEDKLKEYLDYHQAVWPEVEQGFKKAGYRHIRLFRSHHTVVMIVTVPAGADLDAMGKTAEAHHPRCKEWNTLMAGYQEGVAGMLPGQTWSETTPFFEFKQ